MSKRNVTLAIIPALVVVSFVIFGNPGLQTIFTVPIQSDLVGYWNMDDNDISGTTLYDKSGEGNNGTIYGATTTDGKIKQALQFDGEDDYVEVADSSSLDITSAITLEAWAKDPPSWLSGWGKRVKLTIDHTDIDSHLSDFPISIYLSTSTGRGDDDVSFIFDEVGSNSKKIAVTKSDGTTQLYTEVEKWDSSSEQAWFWTNATGTDSVSSTTDTDLYLYYDNSHADNDTYVGDPSDDVVHNVWDDNFKLVTHMRDDPDTSSVRDSTVNANDGTKGAEGEPTIITDGQVDGAQDFDGDDVVNVGDADSLDFGEGDFTVEAWIYIPSTNTGNKAGIRKKASNGATSVGYGWFMNDGFGAGKMYFTYSNGTARAIQTLSTAIHDDSWHKIVGVRDTAGGKLRLYLDGSPDNTTNDLAGSVSNDRVLEIGKGQALLIGKMDEVRISDVARTAAWIKASYESERDDLLDFGSEETPPKKIILSKGDDAYSLKMSSDGLTFYGYISDNEISTSVSTPTNWHHYALTYDGSNQKLYIDGTQATTTPLAESINTNLTNLKIGENFSGPIDEVRIYNQALSASEILQNYNGSKRTIIDSSKPGKTIIQ